MCENVCFMACNSCILRGLLYLHSSRYVHCDIRLANVVVYDIIDESYLLCILIDLDNAVRIGDVHFKYNAPATTQHDFDQLADIIIECMSYKSDEHYDSFIKKLKPTLNQNLRHPCTCNIEELFNHQWLRGVAVLLEQKLRV